MKFWLVVLAFGAVLVLTACGGGYQQQVSTAPVSQNGVSGIPTPQPVAPGVDGNYANGYALPAVTTVYIITGTVEAAPNSIQQYTENGSISGSSYRGTGSVSGYIHGETSGKGFLRFKVSGVSWHDPYINAGIVKRSEDWTPIVKTGDMVLIKTVDTKASALGAGDGVVFMCREQYEFVSAVARDEIPTTQSVTRELDYCRMVSPQISESGK